MRLWSLHPSTLDRQGLIACWREALLAQAVLLERTKGYTRHPQLERFRHHTQPAVAIADYLNVMHQESLRRGYRFDSQRIATDPHSEIPETQKIPVTRGQIEYEWAHLQAKLAVRSPHLHSPDLPSESPPVHPLFTPVSGEVAEWERM